MRSLSPTFNVFVYISDFMNQRSASTGPHRCSCDILLDCYYHIVSKFALNVKIFRITQLQDEAKTRVRCSRGSALHFEVQPSVKVSGGGGARRDPSELLKKGGLVKRGCSGLKTDQLEQ